VTQPKRRRRAKNSSSAVTAKVNYAAVMAVRKNSYAKHFMPSTETVDTFEDQIQEYLLGHYPGDSVFIKVIQEGKRPHSRLWEWNIVEMKHGVSAKAWLAKKLERDFAYTKKEQTAFFNSLVVISVNYDISSGKIRVA
jgi:hypothetical protein